MIDLVKKSWLNGLRKCPVQGKMTFCSGLCSVVYGSSDGSKGSDVPVLCPEFEKGLDLALNVE